MGLPGKRLSSRHRKTRAAHHALKKTTLATCTKCHKPILPHTACNSCGYYKGKNIFSQSLSKKAKVKETTAQTPSVAKDSK